jgi:Ca2+-transporting ATPase
MKVKGIEAIFLLILAIFFLFIGLGEFAEAMAIGALLAGITGRNFLPEKRLEAIDPQIKSITYGFFGPIFFFWVGVDTNVNFLFSASLLVFLVIGVTYSAKILATYLTGKKELGVKPSILMGVGLCVRFSTSLVIIKFLFERTLIRIELYSILIASTIASFIVPFLISYLINKWKITAQTT